MGIIGQIMSAIFGGGRNVVAETVQVFRENAENGAVRDADAKTAALTQLATEFGHARQGWFNRFIDGLNRLPRPMLALRKKQLNICTELNEETNFLEFA